MKKTLIFSLLTFCVASYSNFLDEKSILHHVEAYQKIEMGDYKKLFKRSLIKCSKDDGFKLVQNNIPDLTNVIVRFAYPDNSKNGNYQLEMLGKKGRKIAINKGGAPQKISYTNDFDHILIPTGNKYSHYEFSVANGVCNLRIITINDQKGIKVDASFE